MTRAASTRATSRRAFLLDSAKAASLLALGCSTQERDARVPDGAQADASGSSDASADGSAPDGAASDDDGGGADEACDHTRPDIEGPFFEPSSPERTSLLDGELTGVRLAISGRIVDASCAPLAGAIIDFWQADDAGAYDDAGFRLRGHQQVGADGRYELTTIVPGRYLNGSQYRPAHLHCKVYVEGAEVLTTQLYFEGDPFNEIDPWFSELTMLRTRVIAGGLVAVFDFSVI